MSQLIQPVRLIATTFVPDRKLGGDAGKSYGLILQGDCLYVVVFCNPEVAKDQQRTFLDGKPIEYMLQRDFPDTPGEANEHGHLFFYEEDEQALTWFTEEYTQAGGKITLVMEGEGLRIPPGLSVSSALNPKV
jgi:hypothetical protein